MRKILRGDGRVYVGTKCAPNREPAFDHDVGQIVGHSHDEIVCIPGFAGPNLG